MITMSIYPYTEKELLSIAPSRTYPGEAREAKFLLGGIGTGNISVGARGQLCDWEIFNRQGKGNYLPYSFFAVRVSQPGKAPIAKVLESRLSPPFANSHGFFSGDVAGLPRFKQSVMKGEYPFVEVELADNEFPLQVTMEAFTPFIPLNADESGIPAAVIRYRMKNVSNAPADITVAGSLANAVGYEGNELFFNLQLSEEVCNQYREEGDVKGLYYSSSKMSGNELNFGTMAIMTTAADVTVKEEWLDGYWWDCIHDFWDDFYEDGRLELRSVSQAVEGKLSVGSKQRFGTIGIVHTLAPGEEHVFEFVLSWHFPNRPKSWEGHIVPDKGGRGIEKNYYSKQYSDAWNAGAHLFANLPRLERASRDFRRALFSSTLPSYVIDALAANITVLRSTTCFRIENGTFLGWEGGFDQRGSCEGTCTHVWNYAQTLAFLFPELERTMRRVEFLLETDDQGKMAFRTNQVLGGEKWDMIPATDGQLGTIVRLYREWKISGDSDFLREVWDKASLALDFAFRYWDTDGDFVLDSEQHNTYDIEFFGPNSLSSSMFYAALKAGAEMARFMGDEERAQKYTQAWQEGSRAMDELLWGDDYYIQRIEDVDRYRYQQGNGCLSDQLIGQFLAHVAGVGYVLPEEHVKKAVKSIYDYNFRDGFTDHHNVQRTYTLNDEKGLVLCSWPHGGRPKLPFVYSDEVWTGIEYQVASHLIYEGFITEGLTLTKAVRDRHDGYRRSPWNEVECGHHYVRSMASWGLLTALSGYGFDMVNGSLSFNPRVHADNFSCFWSTGAAWGIYRQNIDADTGEAVWDIEVLYGKLEHIAVNGQTITRSATLA